MYASFGFGNGFPDTPPPPPPPPLNVPGFVPSGTAAPAPSGRVMVQAPTMRTISPLLSPEVRKAIFSMSSQSADERSVTDSLAPSAPNGGTENGIVKESEKTIPTWAYVAGGAAVLGLVYMSFR